MKSDCVPPMSVDNCGHAKRLDSTTRDHLFVELNSEALQTRLLQLLGLTLHVAVKTVLVKEAATKDTGEACESTSTQQMLSQSTKWQKCSDERENVPLRRATSNFELWATRCT